MDNTERLMMFGLTRQEATLYLLLCERGSLTGYEATKQTGISRSNAYTSLASLAEKGAANVIEEAATHYIPVPIKEFCASRQREMDGAAAALAEAVPQRQLTPEGYITIKGGRHIMHQLKNMIAGADERIYISASKELLSSVREEMEALVAQGKKVVIITNPPFALEGASVFHTNKEAGTLRLIVDSRHVLTGDVMGENSTCLFSHKQNLVDLIKESISNEMRLIGYLS